MDQEAGHHPQRCHSTDLIVMQDRAMLDTATQSVHVDTFVASCLDGIKNTVDRGIPVAMQ